LSFALMFSMELIVVLKNDRVVANEKQI